MVYSLVDASNRRLKSPLVLLPGLLNRLGTLLGRTVARGDIGSDVIKDSPGVGRILITIAAGADDRSDVKQAQKRRDLQFIGLVGANYWPVNRQSFSSRTWFDNQNNNSEKDAKDRETRLRKNRQKMILFCLRVKSRLRSDER